MPRHLTSRSVFSHAAFLRAVNLGARHVVSKEALRHAFDAAGATQVETYLASGNVAFCAPNRAFSDFADRVRSLLAASGLDQPLAIVPMAELQALVATLPPPSPPPPGATYLGVFLTFPCRRTTVSPPFPWRSPRGDLECFACQGASRVLLTHRYRLGVAHPADVNAFIERIQGSPSTTRSWNTVHGFVAKFA